MVETGFDLIQFVSDFTIVTLVLLITWAGIFSVWVIKTVASIRREMSERSGKLYKKVEHEIETVTKEIKEARLENQGIHEECLSKLIDLVEKVSRIEGRLEK